MVAGVGAGPAPHHFQRHPAVEAGLEGLVDDPHAPPTQLALDHEAGDPGRRIGVGQRRRDLPGLDVVPYQSIQLVLAVMTFFNMRLDRGERPVPERVGAEQGQRGGGWTGTHGRFPNIGVNGSNSKLRPPGSGRRQPGPRESSG
jgi:hypothetical protein